LLLLLLLLLLIARYGCNAVGNVIRTLPEGEPVRGVTSLDDHLYVIRGNQSSDQIEVYDIDSFRLLRNMTVPELFNAVDIVACGHYRCAYVSEGASRCLHRVTLPHAGITRWPVNDVPGCLSLTVQHTVLVTCRKVCKIKEFTTDGHLLREVVVPASSPWHTVQLSNGELIVCHGFDEDYSMLQRVCLICSDGQIVKSHGESVGAGSRRMNTPSHMAVDRNDFVFVVDRNNCRVLLLSPTLTRIREVVSRKLLQWKPYRLSVDVKRRRLYVAVNERLKYGDYTAGRVIVVNV